MQGDGENGDIDIGDEIGDGAAFVYLTLYPGDVGRLPERTSRIEFIQRKPDCVSQFDETGLVITISNSGEVESDLVTIEYQIIYCTFSGHGPADGFTVTHAGETNSSEMDRYMSMDFIPAQGSKSMRIDFPAVDLSWIRNIYFRARVSTLWSPSVPREHWDFARDSAVTEAHIRLQG